MKTEFMAEHKETGETFLFCKIKKEYERKEEREEPGLGKLGTTRILDWMPWIRGSLSL